MMCRLQAVSFRYPGGENDALSEVSLEVDRGTHLALVGPNGAGKSTLLRIITGVLTAQRGIVTVQGREVSRWRRRDLARTVAVVSQSGEVDSDIRVRDLVGMGRNPHVKAWAPLAARDRRIVEECLEAVDLAALVDRRAGELSGGELQRARLARALAQEPALLLLDEPTAHLDLGHETRFMELVRQLTQKKSLTVVGITHHLNTASRYADHMLLLSHGSVVASGRPEAVLQPDTLDRAFGWPVHVADLGPLGHQVIPARRVGEGQP
jgi:iron complex transport system ATP-binding protein